VPVNEITMENLLSAWFAPRRFTFTLLGIFASLAMVLAVVGIYGVLSYLVMQRTREIGIRMALGADARRVLASIAQEAFLWAACGSALGIAATVSLDRVMRSFLYEVSPTDNRDNRVGHGLDAVCCRAFQYHSSNPCVED
jgi:ABC-type antimicrobial peptide transport system permease subunit